MNKNTMKPRGGKRAAGAAAKKLVAAGDAILLPKQATQWHKRAQAAALVLARAERERDHYRGLIEHAIGPALYGVLPGEPFGSKGCYSLVSERRREYTVPETNARRLRYTRKLPDGKEVA